MKMDVFRVVAPCILVDIALMMEAARTSETLVKLYQNTRCYNPEDIHIHTHRRENLKSYVLSSSSGFLRNVGTYLQVHAGLQPRRPTST
jgi:hypothetical protein